MKRITKIEENKSLGRKKKLRVAAYCRVSTASDEQLVSLAAQKVHYENYIKSNDEWEFAGLYYDEGVTGTKKEKRDGLLSMVADCERGKIEIKLAYLIQRERAEYRGNRRNKGIWRYWIASDAFFFLWVL